MSTRRFHNRAIPLVWGLLLALAAPASQACRATPVRQLIAPDVQVRLATDVALGQVISATPLGGEQVEYRFLALEQLAGPARKVFTVIGSPDRYGKDSAFDGHADSAFWTRAGGRVMHGTDCVIHPSFVVGNSYLVFIDASPTQRSYEKIDMVGDAVNQDDKWLIYVRDQLGKAAAGDAAAPVPAPIPEYERVGRFIYAFHRIVSRDSLERITLFGQHAPTPLLLQAGRLGDEYDHILKNSATVPDAEIAAALRRAAAVRTALDAWRESGSQVQPTQ